MVKLSLGRLQHNLDTVVEPLFLKKNFPLSQNECVESGVQKRNRTLLRTSSSGEKCSESSNRESRACAEACFFRYEWSLTPWSSCQPVGDSSCGEGRRRRGVKCTRLRDGRSVKDSLCPAKDRPQELVIQDFF